MLGAKLVKICNHARITQKKKGNVGEDIPFRFLSSESKRITF